MVFNNSDLKEEKIEELHRIIEKAVHSDKDALLALCREIAKNVFVRVRFLYKGEVADAEDIAQEVLIRICQKIHTLKEPKAFGAWTNSIILNEVRQYQRKTLKHSEVLYLDEYAENVIEVNEENLPQGFHLRQEASRTIKAIIDKLPDRQREAIVFHYYEGMSVTETAELMEIPHQNVSLYLKRGREKIRKELEILSEKPGLSGYHALAAFPIGPMVTQALTQEAEYMTAAGEIWADQAAGSLAQHISGNAENTSLAATTPTIATTATATSAVSLKLVVGITAAAVVVSGAAISHAVNDLSGKSAVPVVSAVSLQGGLTHYTLRCKEVCPAGGSFGARLGFRRVPHRRWRLSTGRHPFTRLPEKT